MNTLEYTALHIEEDATDANEVDPNDWNARVESAADCLIDKCQQPPASRSGDTRSYRANGSGSDDSSTRLGRGKVAAIDE